MKKKGNVSDFTEERNTQLCLTFRRLIHEATLIDLDDIFRKLARQPMPRYYVSEDRAWLVISEHQRTGRWPLRSRERIAMYEEIESKALQMLERGDFERLYDCVFEAVNSPASRVFLTTRSCRTILYNALG